MRRRLTAALVRRSAAFLFPISLRLLDKPGVRRRLGREQVRLLDITPVLLWVTPLVWRQAYQALTRRDLPALREWLAILTTHRKLQHSFLLKRMLGHVDPNDAEVAGILFDFALACVSKNSYDLEMQLAVTEAAHQAGQQIPKWLAMQIDTELADSPEVERFGRIARSDLPTAEDAALRPDTPTYAMDLPVRIDDAVRDQGTRQVEQPVVRLRFAEDVLIYGSGLVVNTQGRNRIVQSDDDEDVADPYRAGHRHYVLGRSGGDTLVAKVPPKSPKSFETGFLLGGRAPGNYFHWLIEYLPRLLLWEQFADHADWPLLTRLPLYPQQYQALAAVAPRAHLVGWKPGTAVSVGRLAIMEGPSIVRDDPRAAPDDVFRCRPALLARLAERVLTQLAMTPVAGQRRIYLARSGLRDITNIGEVAGILKQHGFETIRPERLSFAEQVRLFREAAVVAGPSGAAFSNLMFCRPGTKALIFNAPRHASNTVFSQIAGVSGAEVAQVVGIEEIPRRLEAVPSFEDLLHSNYRIPSERVETALKWAASR